MKITYHRTPGKKHRMECWLKIRCWLKILCSAEDFIKIVYFHTIFREDIKMC